MTDTFHPLDPLTAPEFAKVAEILATTHGVGDGWRYTSIEMVEPAKAEVAAFDATGVVPDRRALATVLDTSNNRTYKSVLSLTDESVLSWDHIPGVQPNFTVDEWEEADEVLRKHPEVIAALAKRGITDMDLVFMDTWTYGEVVMPEKYKDRHLGTGRRRCQPLRRPGQRLPLCHRHEHHGVAGDRGHLHRRPAGDDG
jgi:primary-amine oxidase